MPDEISSPTDRCPDCGSPLPPGLPKGLCPQCALRGVLEMKAETQASTSCRRCRAVTATAAMVDGICQDCLSLAMRDLGQGLEAGLVQQSGCNGGVVPEASTRRSFGDYELLEELARGGMGVVYKARQRSLDRIVAVKMILSGPNASGDFIKRFRIEASAAAALQHPNIVAIHEVGVHQGDHFLVMDYVDGPNLAKLIREEPLSHKRAAHCLKIVSEAIHYAHERGILHRDLKPSNMLIDSNGQPRVTDFGLAKRIADAPEHPEGGPLTQTGHLLGSPGYMPPEQAAGTLGTLGRASDVYSLGATLYHLLTGRPPFGGGSVAETLKQVETQEPVSLRLLDPSVPIDLETICLKCLEKAPVRRYATANQLADDLGRFLSGEPVQARPVSRAEKLWRWGRRNPVTASFVTTLGVALCLSLWLLGRLNEEKNKQKALAGELMQSDRQNVQLTARILRMTDEKLEDIWRTPGKLSMVIPSEEIAALAQIPKVSVANQAALIRWTVATTAEEDPAGNARQHAKLLSELEGRLSQSLGRPVRLDIKLYKFRDELMRDLGDGNTDFGRVGPLRFLRARRAHPAPIPLVVQDNPYRTAVFFTRTNTSIRSWENINGRRVAFGDINATVSYWAQIKLAEHGITATNLAAYDFLESTPGFAEDVEEHGLAKAVERVGFLHSHAEVIEAVLAGRYDVGVALRKAFLVHQGRGLEAIPGTEFESTRPLWVARPDLSPAHVQALIDAMTALRGRWLEMLPERNTGFRAITRKDFAVEDEWLDRIPALFPPKPSPAAVTARDPAK